MIQVFILLLSFFLFKNYDEKKIKSELELIKKAGDTNEYHNTDEGIYF